MNNLYKRNKNLFKINFSFLFIKKGLCWTFCLLHSFAYLQEKDSLTSHEYYYSTGEISSKGIIKNGQPWGAWKNFYPSGIVKSEGEIINGKSDGTWTFYTEKGIRQKTITYQHHIKNGPYLIYDSIGNIQLESCYRNDTLQGIVKTYEKGKIKAETNYKDGKRDGTEKVYDIADGRLIETVQYNADQVESNLRVNRYDRENKKTGLWRTYFPNGKLRSSCLYENGEPVKDCEEWDEKGNPLNEETSVPGHDFPTIRETFHQNGQIAESGAFKDGYKQGVFNSYDSTGVWLGSELYATDTLQAQGFVLPDGRYDSTWVFYYPTRKPKSKGKYKDGLKSGPWIYYYPTGRKEQDGYYRKGLVDGNWTWYYPNGEIRRTEFYNRGLLEGLQTEYDSLGNKLSETNYEANIVTGNWFYHVNDHTEKGEYEMGLKNGPWKYYYLDHTLMFKGTFKDDRPMGKHITYFPSGRKRYVRKYKNGQKHGTWKEFDENGELVHVFGYKNNVMLSADGEKIRKKNR
jgi:antitoxin component YwqK of YwqJK toxin-antitoxin module